MSAYFEIPVTIKKITEKAYLVTLVNEDNKKVDEWIPKSQITETDCLAEGDEGTMSIAAWILKKRGIPCG